ncbi:helix-turn-helix transcriptional regulator [Lacrimispora sp.]|uniref:helix-turn-helix transcriptional regulator n=1 Tax=Lacrimispora sp. TaxID=2719234 RepID=UPI0032E51C68
MYQLDYKAMKAKIDSSGMKQKVVAVKAGMKENHLCLILNGKRKCEAGEYISLCKALDIEPGILVKEVKTYEITGES